MADKDQDKQEEKNGSTATAEPKKRKRRKPKRSPSKPLPPWKVLLHNDDVNEFTYVIETIIVLTTLKPNEAIERTVEAHKKGVSLLLTTHRERAELYQEQFQSKRLTVTIEPAE